MASLVYPAVNAALQAPRVARVVGQGAALGYRAFKARKTIGGIAGAVTTGADMVRRFRKRKTARTRSRSFRRNIRPNSGGKVFGQYAQRTGRSFRTRRRTSKFTRKVRSVVFKQFPTQSLLSTNVLGTADQGQQITLGSNSHQSYTYVGMFGCANLPTSGSGPEATQDQDMWNMYKQWWAAHGNTGGPVNDEKIFNSFQMFVMNCGVTVDFHYTPTEAVEGPVEVTFYVIKPRKSQRIRDKANAGSANNFLDKYANYFNEDYNWSTGTGTPAFNQINPYTTYDATPLDSRSFCKEWKIVAQKSIIVQPDNACSYSWGKKRASKITGSNMDEYDYISGVYTQILIRFKPLGSVSRAETVQLGHVRYRKQYNYKVLENSVATSVAVIDQSMANAS